MPTTRAGRLAAEALVSNIASRHLTNQFYEMKKQLDHKEICSICLESLMECKTCYTLLNCGHALHLRCWLELLKKQDVCPICKC